MILSESYQFKLQICLYINSDEINTALLNIRLGTSPPVHLDPENQRNYGYYEKANMPNLISCDTFHIFDSMIHAVSSIFHEMKPIHFSTASYTHYLNNNHQMHPTFNSMKSLTPKQQTQ